MSNHLRSGRGPKRCPTGSGAGKPIWRRCARTRRRQFGRKTGIFDDRIDRPMSPRVISVFFSSFPAFFSGQNSISVLSPIFIEEQNTSKGAAMNYATFSTTRCSAAIETLYTHVGQ